MPADLAPLDDPTYQPQHPPVNGQIPDVITKWGPRSQVRWFQRFRTELGPRRDWELFYCHSEYHRGLCCTSCEDEGYEGVRGCGDYCCCRDGRLARD
ncbi:hypothetical protein [Actinocrinis sp.]|uniref:hypothetical protein n=1 Tax=Actinocrinis sp. TaxID=1920516 RepID=UPI002D2FB49A|nr:hypothetical protein [Actinocrinis sp.]HZP54350.1 hypothetical protein [Actinocrinis sp.]